MGTSAAVYIWMLVMGVFIGLGFAATAALLFGAWLALKIKEFFKW
jgi:hypothetical protein